MPTDPPPQDGKSCVLLPGRLEKDVLAYNAVAAKVMAAAGSIPTCDVHKAVTDVCGVGVKQRYFLDLRAVRPANPKSITISVQGLQHHAM